MAQQGAKPTTPQAPILPRCAEKLLLADAKFALLALCFERQGYCASS